MPYMPDIDWRNEDASEQFIADGLWWLETFDLDGFRIDAVKHVDDLAVLNLGTRIAETFESAGTDYYLDGETAMGWGGDDIADSLDDYATISRYIGPGGLDGQFDFVLHHAVSERVFVTQERGYLHLDYWTYQSQVQYPEGAVMTPFVGSHDSSRFLSLIDYRLQADISVAHHEWPEEGLPEQPTTEAPYDLARPAFCWLLAVPGAPLIYQGDEYGEYGGHDPDNRHLLRRAGELSELESALLEDLRDLGRARQELEPLRRGSYLQVDGLTETFLAFVRQTDAGDAVLVVINGNDVPDSGTVDLSGTGLASAGGLADQLGWGGSAILSGSSAEISMPEYSCALFVAE